MTRGSLPKKALHRIAPVVVPGELGTLGRQSGRKVYKEMNYYSIDISHVTLTVKEQDMERVQALLGELAIGKRIYKDGLLTKILHHLPSDFQSSSTTINRFTLISIICRTTIVMLRITIGMSIIKG
jgi:hypothetical protein